VSAPGTAAAAGRRYGLVAALASIAMLVLVLAGSSALDTRRAVLSPYVSGAGDQPVVVTTTGGRPPVHPTHPPHTGTPANTAPLCPAGRRFAAGG
jgi:hypothetical protein